MCASVVNVFAFCAKVHCLRVCEERCSNIFANKIWKYLQRISDNIDVHVTPVIHIALNIPFKSDVL